ncbi:MAG: class I SAM-dependent methyltransferase [Actinomycetota bacterium]
MDQDRLRREREFFDASSSAQFGDDTPAPTEHVQALLARVGDTSGMRVLDCGCGAGELTIPIAAGGSVVTAFDVSPESVRLMRERAARDGLRAPDGVVASMERLPFAPSTFDVAVGKSILHHVEIGPAMDEVRRVLIHGGRGVFLENQVTNPVLRFARARLSGRFGVARLGTIDEHPFVARDYAAIRARFPVVRLNYPDFRFFGLFSRNVLRYRRALWLARALGRLDAFVFRHLPFLRKYGYHVILEVRGDDSVNPA